MVALSPFRGEFKETLKNIYVPPKIIARNKIHESKSSPDEKEIQTYNDLFMKRDGRKINIYIQGEPGIGKSTFAAKMALDWCDSLQSSDAGAKQIEGPESFADKSYFTDIKTLKNFDFLFNVPLRYCNKNECFIDDIIENVIFSKLNNDYSDKGFKLIRKLLSEEVCLVILDGLDEWNHQSNLCVSRHIAIPQRRTRWRCSCLTFSRPWMLSDPSLKTIDKENVYDIKGVVSNEALCAKYFDGAKQHSTIKQKFNQFEDYSLQFRELLDTPILATSIFFLWLHTSELPKSFCEVYSSMLQMFCERCRTQTTDDENTYQEFLRLPNCFQKKPGLRKNVKFLDSLGKLAFYTLHAGTKQNTIVLSDEIVNEFLGKATQARALQVGILTRELIPSWINSICKYSFLHKTFQEFLAAFHITTNRMENDELMQIIQECYTTSDTICSMKSFFVFVCGLNHSGAFDLSELFCSVAAREVDKLSNSKDDYQPFSEHAVRQVVYEVNEIQKVLVNGYKEHIANGNKDPQIALKHITCLSKEDNLCKEILKDNTGKIESLIINLEVFRQSASGMSLKELCSTTSKTVMLFNLCCIRKIVDVGFERLTNLKYIVLYCTNASCFEVKTGLITLKSVHLTHVQVEGIKCSLTLDMRSCINVQFMKICKTNVTLRMDTKTLRYCHLEGYNFTTGNAAEILKNSRLLKCLYLRACGGVKRVLQSLSNKHDLLNITLEKAYLSDNDMILSLPMSLIEISLTWVSMTSLSWKHLVNTLPTLPKLKKCDLDTCFITKDETCLQTLHAMSNCGKITVVRRLITDDNVTVLWIIKPVIVLTGKYMCSLVISASCLINGNMVGLGFTLMPNRSKILRTREDNEMVEELVVNTTGEKFGNFLLSTVAELVVNTTGEKFGNFVLPTVAELAVSSRAKRG